MSQITTFSLNQILLKTFYFVVFMFYILYSTCLRYGFFWGGRGGFFFDPKYTFILVNVTKTNYKSPCALLIKNTFLFKTSVHLIDTVIVSMMDMYLSFNVCLYWSTIWKSSVFWQTDGHNSDCVIYQWSGCVYPSLTINFNCSIDGCLCF